MIFFDIDETLIDQRRAEAAAAERFLELYGRELDRPYSRAEFCALWRSLREKHAPAFFAGTVSAHEQRRRRMRELFARAGRLLDDAEVDRRIELYESDYRHSWSLFDDVLPALASLRGSRRGIISNGSVAQQTRKLEQTGVARCFELVLVSEEIGAAKPQREIFLAACRRARAEPERCVYVGDRLEQDARASSAAGMRGVWLCRSEPRARGSDVIGSLTELPSLLRERSAA